MNLLRYLGHGATLVSGPAGQPVLMAFADRRLFAVLVFTIRDNLILKIEATVDPSAVNRWAEFHLACAATRTGCSR